MATYLDSILAWHRARTAADHRSVGEIERDALRAPAPRGFASSLSQPGASVIAEVKRRSPSKGVLLSDLDPTHLAQAYQDGGASALSVLTDSEHFGGSVADLQSAREATSLPVLRKDFTLSLRDVFDARAMGADAVLLIVAALAPAELGELAAAGRGVGLDVLVEVHDEAEADLALSAGATLIGVNQRDLRSFAVDTDRALRVGATLPADVTTVAESGISGPGDVARLTAAGFDAVLVGESLVTSPDPAAAVRALTKAA